MGANGPDPNTGLGAQHSRNAWFGVLDLLGWTRGQFVDAGEVVPQLQEMADDASKGAVRDGQRRGATASLFQSICFFLRREIKRQEPFPDSSADLSPKSIDFHPLSPSADFQYQVKRFH